MCYNQELYINIFEKNIVISRCCNFIQHPNNCFSLDIEKLPKNDQDLKNLIFEYSKRPSSFKDLIPNKEKLCNISCEYVFKSDIKNININVCGCNLHCVMCPWTNNVIINDMNNIYERICHIFLNENFFIRMTSIGEPFIHRQIIDEFLNKKRPFTAVTNLQCINDNDIIKMSQIPNLCLDCSVDSVNEDIYRSIRIPSSHETFLKVLNTAKKLAELNILKHNSLTIVDQNLNLKDLINTYDFFKNINVETTFAVDGRKREELLKHPIVQELLQLYPNNWRI